MPDKLESPLRSPKSALILLLLMGGGLLGNFLRIPLFFGVDFLFGSIAVMLAVGLLGLWPAILTALVASAYTFFLWDHPWAVVTFTLEALFVGSLYGRRSHNLLVLGTVYWLFIAPPLVAFFYQGALRMEWADVVVIMLKQGVNGIFNAMLAGALLIALLRWKVPVRGFPTAGVSLYDSLFLLVAAAVFVPSLLITVAESRRVIQEIERETKERLERNSVNLANHIELWRENHSSLLEQFGSSVTAGIDDPSLLQARMAFLRHNLPGIGRIFARDASGEIIASSPSDLADQDPDDVLTGPARAPSLLWSRTFPLPDGEELELTAFLKLDSLEQILVDHAFRRDQLAVLYRNGHLLAGGNFSKISPGSLLHRNRTGAIGAGMPEVFIIGPNEGASRSRMAGWRESYYARESPVPVGADDWTLLMAIPVQPFRDRLYMTYTENLSLALLFAVLALIAAGAVSRRTSGPIQQLARITSDFPQHLSGSREVAWPKSEFSEIALLLKNFQKMSINLRTTFDSLNSHREKLVLEVKERRQAEVALREAEGKLREHAEELEAKVASRTVELRESVESLEGFCYTIAHDLRAPLRSIQGFSSMLCQAHSEELSEEAADFLDRIQKSAIHMDRMICNLLDYGRLGHRELPAAPLDLSHVVDRTAGGLSSEALSQGIEIQVRHPLGSVVANATIMEQILTNLLSNAIKYGSSGNGGVVTVWTERNASTITLFVRDTGAGIDPRNHEKIFALFERLDQSRPHPGTGIGLAIVRKGAEKLGGRVGVDSSPGKGATFWVELPASGKESETENAFPASGVMP